ncbi:MAG: glycerol-3-phosphate dehydrogenase/oxidase [Bacteroidota bacterium]|nr:glycerol-3-phosphate dehydrogenase/oxidase [Bacteroidota bacterium]
MRQLHGHRNAENIIVNNNTFNRQHMISRIQAEKEWDICIIGGGATGLGVAVDAVTRGLKTLLVEKYDFAKGTSSRSTKLVHGGVRYLRQGNFPLVKEALKERGLLLHNAPHLVKKQSFVIPNYTWWETPFYGMGLKAYDWLAGDLGFGHTQMLSKEETVRCAPTLQTEGLQGGVLYYDGQFDDARLALHLAMTAAEHGAVLVNYMSVEHLMKTKGKICGVGISDMGEEKTYEVQAKTVINATGVFANSILKMDHADAPSIVTVSQGIHVVVDKEFLPSATAIMIPNTDDNRVLFAVPWHNKTIIGTTDTPIDTVSAEPVALNDEVDFVMHHIGKYLTKKPLQNDIRSIFAGLRPLVKDTTESTASLSREHHVTISDSNLVSIVGGKWTTYRKMAEDVLHLVMKHTSIEEKPCTTQHLKIHGWKIEVDFTAPFSYYGYDEAAIQSMITDDSLLGEKIHRSLPFVKAEFVWAARNEMCMTVDDALSRRTRALLLDAHAAIESAPIVAKIIANEMNKDEKWIGRQVEEFTVLAKHYLPKKSI